MKPRLIKRPARSPVPLRSSVLAPLHALVLIGYTSCSGDEGPGNALDPLAQPETGNNSSTAEPNTHTPETVSNSPHERASSSDEPSATPTQATTDSITTTTQGQSAASTIETPPPSAHFEGLPIPIAYVGMTDTPGGVTQFAASAEFADCPTGMALGWDQQVVTSPLWSDCAASHITERINRAFQELLHTDQVLFESLGYSTVESPQYSVFTSRAQVDAALQALDATEFNSPGRITAIVSNWTHSIGGLAPYDQPLDDANGIVLAISQVSDDAVIHEVGHTLGFMHTDEDPAQIGVMTYDFCEPLSAPILPKCNCEMNLMEAVSGVCAAQCGDKAYGFDTATHGEYFRDVATCWLNERRFAGRPVECDWPEVAHCTGYENTGMTCSCLNGTGSMRMESCADATDAEITELLETCEATPSTDNLCMSFEAYPGVYCFEHAGTYDCACLSDDTPFASGKPCEEFTAQEIYATCLGSQPQATCQTALGGITLSCAEDENALNCICSNTGSTLISDNTKCTDVDLNDWILSCPEN